MSTFFGEKDISKYTLSNKKVVSLNMNNREEDFLTSKSYFNFSAGHILGHFKGRIGEN